MTGPPPSLLLTARYGPLAVPVHVGRRLPLPELFRVVWADAPPDRAALLSDAHVGPLHAPAVEQALAQAGWPPTRLDLPVGEGGKRLSVLEDCAERLLAAGLTRRSALVALGGGVVGDAVGFLAGIYLRGVAYLQLPTSLLAQVDSAHGGKVGVNLHRDKNALGLFHHPAATLVDTAWLDTLPPEEFANAGGEVIKYALTLDEPLCRMLADLGDWDELRVDPGRLGEVVTRCVRAKVAVVEADEREAGPRMVLNFGHTVGHALEAAGGFSRLRHGEAVAWGIIAAQRLGAMTGHVPVAWAVESEALVRRLTPLPPLGPVDVEGLLTAVGRDKKTAAGQTRFVFSPGPGRHQIVPGVDPAALRLVLARLAGAAP